VWTSIHAPGASAVAVRARLCTRAGRLSPSREQSTGDHWGTEVGALDVPAEIPPGGLKNAH